MTQRPRRILIADDELLARQRLSRLLSAFQAVTIVAECENGREVLDFLDGADEQPDILMMDIRMPELTGLEARALLPDTAPYVVFTTAYSEHALEAFDVGADDYLLKPIEVGHLKRAMERAEQRLGSTVAGAVRAERIPVQTSRGIVFVAPGQLSHAEIDGALTTLHTVKGPVLADFSLQHLHGLLPDARFWRVHRRALINLDFVERLESVDSGGYIAHMVDGSAVTVSRQAGRRLRRQLGLPS